MSSSGFMVCSNNLLNFGNIFQTKILPIYGVSKACIVSRFFKISLFSKKK
ncbi:hypothetical protein Avbf_13767, partial [Armadillidium vulgare]